MKRFISIFFVILGLVIVGVSILGIIDPVGTQAANDGDPFGTPPSIIQGITTLIVGIIFCLSPIILLRKNKNED